MKPVVVGIVVGLVLMGLAAGLSGCFLGFYQTADTIPPGEYSLWWALGAVLATSEINFDSYVPQLRTRYGVASRIDVTLGAGLAVEQDLQNVAFLGITGDLRYRLIRAPDITLGFTPGSFPLFGHTLGAGTVYVSHPLGPFTPYGIYRLTFVLEDGLGLSHQAAWGLELDDSQGVPAVFEITWKDGRVMLGLAFRF